MGPAHDYRLCAILVSALGIAACEDRSSAPADTADWRVERDTLGDTIVARTLSGRTWAGTATLTEELSIGSVEGPEQHTFGNIVAVQPGRDGSLFVLDAQVPVLRKFAADGRHVADIGRAGSGPGEYARPDGLQIDRAGRIVLSDAGNLRIHVYTHDGQSLESLRLPARPLGARPLHVDTAGNIYYGIAINRESAPPEEWIAGLVRLAGNRDIDTLLVPYAEQQAGLPRLTARRGGRTSSYLVPFGPTRPWTFSRFGYFVAGVTSRYAVDLIPPDDGTIHRIERVSEPVRVNDREKAEQEERLTLALRAVDPTWRWDGPGIPDVKRAYHSLLAGPDGRIWVQVAQPAVRVDPPGDSTVRVRPGQPAPAQWIEPMEYDVFESDGRYLGPVRVPDRVTVHAVSGEYVWAVRLGEFDEQYVVRYRISVR